MTSDSNTSPDNQTSPHTKPITTYTKNGIEIIELAAADMGSHAEHWDALTPQADTDVPQWLSHMLDQAIIPLGLHKSEDSFPSEHMLLTTKDAVHPCQIIALDNHKKPSHLVAAFPSIDSPYDVTARIERIILSKDDCAAVLRLGLADGTTLYAFDSYYAINADLYESNSLYNVYISGLAHHVEKTQADDTMTVTDPEAIRHHRALNAILAEHDGVAPDDLQEKLAAWQPSSDADTLPVTLNMSSMCAYLYGECLGQEDEAWCQGEILGLQNVTIFSQSLYLLDIAVLREEDTQPVVVRIAAHSKNTPENLQVGDFIRTNVWFQAKIRSVNMNNS